MPEAKREYSGAALSSFVLAFENSDRILKKVLDEAGVDRIDPEGWYDYDWAISVFCKIGQVVGRGALIEVGRKMIETAVYPPGIHDIHTLLAGLDMAYQLNTRGPNCGNITCTFEDDHSATLVWGVKGPYPCAFCWGILEGSCARYGVKALIEHGADGCKDDGADVCIYHVTW